MDVEKPVQSDMLAAASAQLQDGKDCPAPPETVVQTAAATSKDIRDAGASNDGRKETQAGGSIPYYRLFSFADGCDIVMLILATMGAVVNGVAMPILILLFGNVFNSFGQNTDDVDLLLHRVSKVALQFVYVGCGSAVGSFARNVYLFMPLYLFSIIFLCPCLHPQGRGGNMGSNSFVFVRCSDK
eukprot:c6024_g1_i2 orf=53-607(-)